MENLREDCRIPWFSISVVMVRHDVPCQATKARHSISCTDVPAATKNCKPLRSIALNLDLRSPYEQNKRRLFPIKSEIWLLVLVHSGCTDCIHRSWPVLRVCSTRLRRHPGQEPIRQTPPARLAPQFCTPWLTSARHLPHLSR